MSDLVPAEKKPRMTVEEIKRAFALIPMLEKGVRFILLEMSDRKAHVVMRVPNFAQFCRDHLGAKYSDSYVSQLLHAARVERALGLVDGLVDESLDLSKLGEIKKPKLSIAATYEIGKLPEEKWSAAYDEYCMRDKGDRTPGDLLTELKRIVKRRMSEGAEPAAVQPVAPVEAPRVKPNLTPIVPPVYDGTPEQIEPEPPAPVRLSPTPRATAPAAIAPETVPFVQYSALLCIARSFASAVDSADTSAAIEALVDFRRFLKEYAP